MPSFRFDRVNFIHRPLEYSITSPAHSSATTRVDIRLDMELMSTLSLIQLPETPTCLLFLINSI